MNQNRSLVNKKNGTTQQSHRSRFGVWSNFIAKLYPVLAISYPSFNKKRVALMAEFTKKNFKEGISLYEPYHINFSQLLISKGGLLPFSQFKHQLINGTLELSWNTPKTKLNGNDNDEVCLAIYYPELNQLEVIQNVTTRSQNKLSFSFDQDLPASSAQCYIFLVSCKNNGVSNSFHIEVPNFKV